MQSLDLVVCNGMVATGSGMSPCDVGVKDGRIVALGEDLPGAARTIDASGKLVLPGGVDSHCHIEQRSSMGVHCADDFYSGTVSAAFGGTTTIIPFAAQHRGDSLRQVVNEYHERAGPKAVVDYAFHLIVSDPTEHVLGQELPALIKDGYTSFKVYMTYEQLRLNDYQLLDVFATARRDGALVMVHAENHEVIEWLTRRLLDGAHRAPRYHSVAHARIAESEATHRAIAFAELVDVPILVVHVSAKEAVREIRHARRRGLRIYAETCPQYLFLTADDLDRPGLQGAKYCCSPPPRDAGNQAVIWDGLADGTFDVYSSDHAPYRFDESGKLAAGSDPAFKDIANGVPGLELRLPLLFSEGVKGGRISLQQFVELGATNAAKLYGLYPRKGAIAVGADADLSLWDPDKEVTVRAADLHDNVGYTPYEGRRLCGWPVTVISRGRVVVEDRELWVERGSGEFLPCAHADKAVPSGMLAPELDPDKNFGVALL